MNFKVFFVNFFFIDIFVKISIDISDISVKFKYRSIIVYRYFDPWLYQLFLALFLCLFGFDFALPLLHQSVSSQLLF